MVDGKKISGSICVGVVIFIVGILTIEALEQKNENSNYDYEDRTQETDIRIDPFISQEVLLLEEVKENQEKIIRLLQQRGIESNNNMPQYDALDDRIINYDITLNQTIDGENCFYERDGALWKLMYCEE